MRYQMGDVLRVPCRAFNDRRIVVVSDDDGGSEVVDVITQPWDEVDTAFRSSPGSVVEEYPTAVLVSRSESCERVERLEDLLLRLELVTVDDTGRRICPTCRVEVLDPSIDAELIDHAPDCALQAELRFDAR
jgi:hypothetical protein